MNSFSNLISNMILDYISNRINTVFKIDKELVKKAILDETFVLEEEKKEEVKLDETIYIYNFKDLTYRGGEEFWKHVGIKIEGKKYRLQLSTNLILEPKKDGKLYLIGMRNKESECMTVDELDQSVLKWCEIHSINV